MVRKNPRSNERRFKFGQAVSKDKGWRQANRALVIAILLVNSYVIALPFLPGFWYWWQTRSTESSSVQTVAAAAKTPSETSKEFHADAQHDGLIIPRMLLDTPLIRGPERDSFNLLNKGAWHLPFSATPDTNGNTVIAGHRFSYTGPRGVFYYLDKLRVGDEIGLWYQGKLYTYIVQSSRTVPPTAVEVQQPTKDTRLTLYTCTPLWNPKDRLVVVALPKEAI